MSNLTNNYDEGIDEFSPELLVTEETDNKVNVYPDYIEQT